MKSFRQFVTEKYVRYSYDSNKPIGPHEGNEISLMLSGKKPVAALDVHHLPELEKHVKAGKLIHKVVDHPVIPGHKWVFAARPGEEWRLNKLHDSFNKLWTGPKEKKDLQHAKIGRLLGYPKESVRAFLDQKR